MYKLLLCWRYLKTRYLALACIVSVMLGVATLIVVNSVMGGFSSKLRERLHGLISDVVVESRDTGGFDRYEEMMAVIRADPVLGKHVEAMAPTLEIFAVLQTSFQGRPRVRPIRLVGIDPEQRAKVGGFAEHLVRRPGQASFDLDEEAKRRHEMNNRLFDPLHRPGRPEPPAGEPPPPEVPMAEPFKAEGAIVGYALAHYRFPKPDEEGEVEGQELAPGDDVVVTTISGAKLAPATMRLAVADYFKSEMSEYDSQFVFVPLDYLQKVRAMEGKVTSIQIKLKDEKGKKEVVERLRMLFEDHIRWVQTWEDKQGALLAAISVEKGILNILLFLIIAVAGFGILAIFSMIVVEKTRDIGVLKALGASSGGVMQIFLGYGLLLGTLGAALGTFLGLLITNNINAIEKWLSWATGMEVFPRTIYYFDQIPTDIQGWQIAGINAGSVAIAVVFSILPALRAAWLHPVKALRYE
ncbi:MAG: ABC transporter permease [Gemmataceae bacterium]|nr:ABC transporter permease [Gemmataceae bacterium]